LIDWSQEAIVSRVVHDGKAPTVPVEELALFD
jgi:hypothetical protein